MSGDLAPLGAIDPEARYVEFRGTQCYECGASGPLTLVDNAEWVAWFDKHTNTTGHREFYQYKVERSRGASVDMPKTKRRPLGQR